jgi:hypothetical protein
MLDQTSSVDNPMHLIIRSPLDLQVRYSDDHPDIKDFISSFNQLAAVDGTKEQNSERARLAETAEKLQLKYAERHLSSLSQLLGYAAQLLQGDYPLRPVRPLPSLHISGH